MSDDRAGRRFSREETALILRRATEGEQRLERADGGLTLDEIVAAAREAGIDPEAVRRAAALSALPGPSLGSRLLGAPSDFALHATFPGRIDPERIARGRTAIDRALGRRGRIEAVGGTLIWREDHRLGRTELEVHDEGGSFEVTATAERKGHLLALVAAVSMGVGAAMVPLGGFIGASEVLGALGSALAPIAGIFGATRLIWPRMQRQEARRLEAAMLELGALGEEPRENR